MVHSSEKLWRDLKQKKIQNFNHSYRIGFVYFTQKAHQTASLLKAKSQMETFNNVCNIQQPITPSQIKTYEWDNGKRT